MQRANNETKRTRLTVQDMVRLSVLVAIMLLLELTGLGMIKSRSGDHHLSRPCHCGRYCHGSRRRRVPGRCVRRIAFGSASAELFSTMLLGINPVFTFWSASPTRILAGYLAALRSSGVCTSWTREQPVVLRRGGLIGALCNTVLFMTTLACASPTRV